MRRIRLFVFFVASCWAAIGLLPAAYVNFEVSHVHPIDLTPSGGRLLAVNTPDALLEVFAVQPDGSLVAEEPIPVGLEPVTVAARTDGEAWVVNHLSDTVSIVDLALGIVTKTLFVGDEPTDVVFAAGRAFVTVSSLDTVRVYTLANLDAAPSTVSLAGREVRALAVANDGQRVYAVPLKSGNRTTILGVEHTFPGQGLGLDPARLTALNLRDIVCDGPVPSYPPLPGGITRNPALNDPPDGVPRVGLVVAWNEVAGQWQDEIGQDWSHCLRFTLSDHDLFVIDATSLAVTEVDHLGTSLFGVSVHPNGKIYVANTEARNFVRFEHELGVQGHVVDNRLSIVDPGNANAVTLVDLNNHIDRSSDPATNLAEREVSIAQPGMLVWKADGSKGYLTAIGSRKVFVVDGGCVAGSCIFGANRAAPDAIEVGEGPTGAALLEGPTPDDDRLYVLNRISHSVAVLKPHTLQKLDEIPLHDPSSENTRLGRRFLYDAIDTSGHGDASCSSCHLSGDMDGLAWDLGNPEGDLQSYGNAMDNVRFVVPLGETPVECPPEVCASHEGFDPQKGPMTTQTLRGMLEPLHWRGDRATMNDFNMAFVGLMGTEDVGPVNGKPAGLSAADMERFRQFALEIHYPSNPYRRLNDSTPCGLRADDPLCEVQPHGALFPGNPTEGAQLFDNHPSDAGQSCASCHEHPFGVAGGALGGVEPAEPTSSDAAALFNGDADGSPHSDLKIPHLRNMHEKFGPVLADPGDTSMPPTPTGFGYVHDGVIPDMYRFLSAAVFNLSAANQAQQVRDLVAFLFHFPTTTKPAVGRQITVPEGTPPTGSTADETLLTRLMTLSDLADTDRHCELVAATVADGRLRRYHLSGGTWVTDVAGEPPLTTVALRENAAAPVTFTCATLDAGQRLGGDRDEDSFLDGDDCADGDAQTWLVPAGVDSLLLSKTATTNLTWTDQSAAIGPSVRYDVLGGNVSDLNVSGIGNTTCFADDLADATFDDLQADPPAGDGFYYLIRVRNPCGVGDLGAGREPLLTLDCSAP